MSRRVHRPCQGAGSSATPSSGSAIAGAGISTLLQSTPARAASDPTSYLPGADDLHMLRRATWGPTPELDKQIGSLGVNRWLDQQLNPGSIDDHACIALIADRFPRLAWTLPQAYRHPDQGWPLMLDLGIAAIARAAWSKRQLFEVMVDFWSNHLNVTNFGDNVWWSRHDYDRAVIRRHALGKFSDMLAASATHPAMMMYLNNAESTKDNPNENYGRELLELHTVGVDAGYTEDEMRTSALGPDGLRRRLVRLGGRRHLLLQHGEPLHGSGAGAGLVRRRTAARRTARPWRLSYVDYLAHHPATAQRIAHKLCQRFVSDAPPAALVDALAEDLPGTRHRDRARCCASCSGPRRSAAPRARRCIRPMQDVVATLRILGIKAGRRRGDDGLSRPVLDVEGMSDAPMAWVAAQRLPGLRGRVALGGRHAEPLEHAPVAGRRTGGRQPQVRRTSARSLLPDDAAEGPRRARPDARQAAGVPHAGGAASRRRARRSSDGGRGPAQPDRPRPSDWRLPYLVALILDSPYHGIR